MLRLPAAQLARAHPETASRAAAPHHQSAAPSHQLAAPPHLAPAASVPRPGLSALAGLRGEVGGDQLRGAELKLGPDLDLAMGDLGSIGGTLDDLWNDAPDAGMMALLSDVAPNLALGADAPPPTSSSSSSSAASARSGLGGLPPSAARRVRRPCCRIRRRRRCHRRRSCPRRVRTA